MRRTALALCLAAGALFAQAPLTLDEAIRRAQLHPAALAAAEHARAAHLEAQAEQGAFWPELDAAATGNRGYPGSSGGLGITGMNNSPFRHEYGAGLEARATLWDFGRTLGRVRGAQMAAERSDSEAEAIRQDLRLEVTRRFHGALAAQAQWEAARERSLSSVELRDQVKALSEAGLRPSAELAMAEADLAASRSAEVQARAALASARARLAVLVGDDPATPREPEPTIPRIEPLPPLEAFPAEADQLPDMRAAQAGLQEAMARKAAAQAEHLPKFVASGSLGYANPPSGQEPGRWAVAVGISLPLFRGGRDLRHTQAAEARVKEQELRVADLRRTLRLEAVEAHDQVKAGVDLLQSAEVEASEAETSVEAAKASFAAGLLPYADVARTVAALAEAHAQLGRARARYAIARAEWARVTGSSPASQP